MASDALEAIARLSEREQRRIAASQGGGLTAGSMDKVAALRDVTAALGSIEAEHALIGGVAVGIRSGIARATEDTDLAIRSSVPRATAIEALVRAGFELRGEHAHSVNFRHRSGEPVQLVFDAGFDAMIDRAELLELGGDAIRVVLTEDLIAMKERAADDPARRASKALRDRADVALLRGDVPEPDEGW